MVVRGDARTPPGSLRATPMRRSPTSRPMMRTLFPWLLATLLLFSADGCGVFFVADAPALENLGCDQRSDSGESFIQLARILAAGLRHLRASASTAPRHESHRVDDL